MNVKLSKSEHAIAEKNNHNSNCDDDDDDSLASALSDYNGAFYDALPITDEMKKPPKNLRNESDDEVEVKIKAHQDTKSLFYRQDTLKLPNVDAANSGGSIDSSFEENKTDDDVDSMSLEDEIDNDNNDISALLSNNLNSNDEHQDVDLEFENYLNNDEEEFNNFDDQSLDDKSRHVIEQNLTFKSNKLRLLEDLKYDKENLDVLRQLAIEKYGFMNKRIRRMAWPILILNQKNLADGHDSIKLVTDMTPYDLRSILDSFKQITDNQIKSNKYHNQVTLDVVRTLRRFPPEISDKLRLKLQDELIDLIVKILVKHDHLHYYQGYHDICLTFLLVTGVENSLPLLEKLTLTHLTPYMETTMESTLKLLFNIMPLLDKIRPDVAEHIQKAELGVIFCISWLITWYSHVMDNLKIILRLYDFFIATHPLMPIYLGAIIVSDKSNEILEIDCDMASLHTAISKYPSKIEDIEILEDYLKRSLKLFEKYQPKSLTRLNENWLDKCKKMEQDRLKEEMLLRQRRGNKKYKNEQDDDNVNNKIAKRNIKTSLGRYKRLPNGKHLANKLLVGLTFTVGVAAVAMYAINTNSSQPQDIISKFYQFLTYKDF